MPSSFLHPFTPPRREEFISISGGEGAVVCDDQGNRYLDENLAIIEREGLLERATRIG